MTEALHFKVHTPALLKEIMSNPSSWALKIPMQAFANLLGKVAERASELNDPTLNRLMVDLTLYDIADPYSPGYDPVAVAAVMETAK